MRTQSEIKKNNIRKANLMMESNTRRNKGQVANQFGLYEQCAPARDLEGEYMGAPMGTEPMMDTSFDMMGDDMLMDFDVEIMDDDDMPMGDDMMLFMMQEDKKSKPDFLDLDGDGDKTEPMKKAAKDKVDEAGCGSKRSYKEAYIGGREQTDYCCDSMRPCCTDPNHPNYDDIHPLGHGYGKVDHSDRDKFDGRKSRVIGVDSDIEDQRLQKENYKAVSATPSRDSWGNKYNNILTESNQVNGVKSLMQRMKKVIR